MSIEHKKVNFNSRSSSDNNLSVWMAKRQRSKIEKDLDILKNRINLLSQEEIRIQKKFQQTKLQTDKIINLKLSIEEMKNKKKKKETNNNQELQQKKEFNRKQRYEQHQSLMNLKEALIKMKRDEIDQIKKIKKLNLEKMKQIQDENNKGRKQKYLQVKDDLARSRYNVNNFWQQKQKYYTEQHLLETFEQEAITKLKEDEIASLERKEMDLIKKLDKTTLNQIKLEEKMENAMVLPTNVFIKKYDLEKTLKNDKNTITAYNLINTNNDRDNEENNELNYENEQF